MHITELSELKKEALKLQSPTLSMLDTLKSELKDLMKPIEEIEALLLKAQQIAQGTSVEKSFSFKGVEYNKKNLENGYTFLLTQREGIFNEDFKKWDTSFCAFHYALADKLGKTTELISRYEQHDAFSNLYKKITGIKNAIYEAVNKLQEREDVTQEQVNSLTKNIKLMADGINDELKTLETVTFVPLPNIDTIQELKEAVVEGGVFKREHGKIFENGGFNNIMANIENSILNCQRIDQKSIGAILAFHKELQNEVS